jgi:hypothetical protein
MGRLEATLDKHYADAQIRAVFAAYRAGDEADVLRMLAQLDNGQLVEIVSLADEVKERSLDPLAGLALGKLSNRPGDAV